MASGETGYTSTPWGLYTQQQLFFLMCFIRAALADDLAQPESNIEYVHLNWYEIGWPYAQTFEMDP